MSPSQILRQNFLLMKRVKGGHELITFSKMQLYNVKEQNNQSFEKNI